MASEQADLAEEARRLSATLRADGAAHGNGEEGPFQGPFRGTYLWRPLARGDERMAPSLHPLGWTRAGSEAPVETGAPAAAGKDAGQEKSSPASSSEETEQRSWFLQLSTALGLEEIVSVSVAAEAKDCVVSPVGVAVKAASGPHPEDGADQGASGGGEGSAIEDSCQSRSATQAAGSREMQRAKEKEVMGQPADAVPTVDEGSNPAERVTMSALSTTSLTSSQRSVMSFGSGSGGTCDGDASILSLASTVGEEAGLMNALAVHALEGAGEENESKDQRGMDLFQQIAFLEHELIRSREGSREREMEAERERGLQHATIVALEERCAALEQGRGRSRLSRWGPEPGLGHVSAWLPSVGDASLLEPVRRNSKERTAPEKRDQVATEEEEEWEWEWERWGNERRDLQWRVERAGAKERLGSNSRVKQRGRGRSFELLRVIPPPLSEDAYSLLIPFFGIP